MTYCNHECIYAGQENDCTSRQDVLECMQNTPDNICSQSKLLFFLMRTSRSSRLALKRFLLPDDTIPAVEKTRSMGVLEAGIIRMSIAIGARSGYLSMFSTQKSTGSIASSLPRGLSNISPLVPLVVTDWEWMHEIDSALLVSLRPCLTST